MPTYAYRCPTCGDFEHLQTLAADHGSSACPRCRAVARRVYRAPALTKTSRALDAAVTRAGLSSERPDVVRTAHPGGASSPASRRTGRRGYPALPRP